MILPVILYFVKLWSHCLGPLGAPESVIPCCSLFTLSLKIFLSFQMEKWMSVSQLKWHQKDTLTTFVFWFTPTEKGFKSCYHVVNHIRGWTIVSHRNRHFIFNIKLTSPSSYFTFPHFEAEWFGLKKANAF